MGKVISFIIQKGGCGKTTTTANTAGYLADNGFKVLAVDMDPQGNLTQHLGYDNEILEYTLPTLFLGESTWEQVILRRQENLHLLPHNQSKGDTESNLLKAPNREYLLRDVLSPHLPQYDYVLIDCPPVLGLYAINALATSHEFVIVVSPEFFPMKAIKPLYQTFRTVKYQLNHSLQFNGILLTMCDFRTRHHQEVLQILRRNFPHKLYRAFIRNTVSLKEAGACGQTIFEYQPYSTGAFDYQHFAEEFVRDHDKTLKKSRYYQDTFEGLSAGEQEQILQFAERNLSAFTRTGLDKYPEHRVIRESLRIERNKVIEKLFPYRTGAEVKEPS